MNDAPNAPGGGERDETRGVDRPLPAAPGPTRWGSDVVADLLRALDVEFVALTPGASFRGLHDSLVNRLGNARPEMLLALHEESAVAIAHGYARVTGRPMAVALHANVGLMHATMAIFNAWCDRIPMLLLGGVGPMDAMQRRPWVDWIHTARDLGALVRGYTKWDDQPASIGAALEAIVSPGGSSAGCVVVVLSLVVDDSVLMVVLAAPTAKAAARINVSTSIGLFSFRWLELVYSEINTAVQRLLSCSKIPHHTSPTLGLHGRHGRIPRLPRYFSLASFMTRTSITTFV
jgi:hypothetical protein